MRHRLSYQKRMRRDLRYLVKTVDNFRTILKDTDNKVAHVLQSDYNCMGYALGMYDWLNLDDFWAIGYDYDDVYENEDAQEELEDMTLCCVQELERNYPVRRIKRPEDASKDERVFAFRCGYDDFHFARLNSDGVWTHKPGGNFIREMTEEELYSDAWCDHRYFPYTSTIYFFAMSLTFEDQYIFSYDD